MRSALVAIVIASISVGCTKESEPTTLSAERNIEAEIADQYARLEESARRLADFRQRFESTLPNGRAESDPQLTERLQQMADQERRLVEQLEQLRAEMRDRLIVQLPNSASIPGNWQPFRFMGQTYYFSPLAM